MLQYYASVLCCQYYPASIILPVLCCQYYAASIILPVLSCQYYPASIMLPVLSCQYYPASIILPALSCQYYPASIILPVLCCSAILMLYCQYYASVYSSLSHAAYTDFGKGEEHILNFRLQEIHSHGSRTRVSSYFISRRPTLSSGHSQETW